MKKNVSGFTLLELIIVIIIVGVLASLALPRFFRVVERSRSAEGLVMIKTIRQAIERCYLMSGGSYGNCLPLVNGNTWDSMGIEDPATLPNAHFQYTGVFGGTPPGDYFFTVERNLNENTSISGQPINYNITCGSTSSGTSTTTGVLTFCQAGNSITITGHGIYEGMKF